MKPPTDFAVPGTSKQPQSSQQPSPKPKHHHQHKLLNCYMKPSLSLQSLPPQSPQENTDMAQAKLQFERPYNSLKVSC